MASVPPTLAIPIPKGSFPQAGTHVDQLQQQQQQPLQQPAQVRLSTRRGSMAAPDPWSLNVPQQTTDSPSPPGVALPSSSASRITIVRVQDSASSAINLEDPGIGAGGGASPGSNTARPRPGRSNSWGSNYSTSSNASSAAGTTNNPRNSSPAGSRRPGGRMSFAFASFTPIVPPNPPPAPESPVSERPSPVYPSSSRSTSGGFTTPNSVTERHRRTYSNPSLAPVKPTLSAQQIYDLAVSSMAPPRPTSPGGTYLSRSRPGTPGVTEQTTPAVFTPMPEEVYLPFVDRPAEVTQLLNEYPTSRLFHLLEALFPADMRHGLGRTRSENGEEEDDDPTRWTFERLSQHLQQTTRAEMNDKLWVEHARACIRSRSEALWERFKGALGVPSELEVDNDWDDEEEDEVPEPVEVLEGEAAAPVLLEPTASPAATDLRISTSDVLTHTPADVAPEDVEEPQAFLEPVFADEEPDEGEIPANMISSGGLLPSGGSEGGWSNRYMENIGEGEEEAVSEAEDAAGEDLPAAGGDGGMDESTLGATDNAVNISVLPTPASEPGSAPSSYFAPRRAHFGVPERSDPSGELDTHGGGPLSPSSHVSNASQREIRALQITTSPAPNSAGGVPLPFVAGAISSPSIPYSAPPSSFRPTSIPNPDPKSPLSPSVPNTSSLVWDNSRATSKATNPASTTSPTSGRVLRRPSESISDALKLPSSSRESHMYQGFGGYGLTNPNKPYHPALSERGPGNPLFPSSFADLSVGPTLAANIPRHSRSVSVSQATHYPPSLGHSFKNRERESGRISPGSAQSVSPLRRYASLGGGGGGGSSHAPPSAVRRAAFRGTWAEVRDKYEYAVTVASMSSDGGRG